MKRIASVSEMQQTSLEERRRGRRIGLVPTLGALHEGHLSLVRLARERVDVVVVSVFVNPLQFGPREDFTCYPRNLDRDGALCDNAGVDVLFHPDAAEMYVPGHCVYVEEMHLSTRLCGSVRPGHFRGVTTVVAQLFNIVLPHVAVFGQKDAQQAQIVRQMVRDLHFPLEIAVAPTVREPDGLAMSSRNARLTPDSRRRATCLWTSLQWVRGQVRTGQTDAAEMKRAMAERLRREGGATVDYVEIVDAETWAVVDAITRPVLVVVAAQIGGVRLIDNLLIEPGDASPDCALPPSGR
jgi:pantoate--beta-alanine ligase